MDGGEETSGEGGGRGGGRVTRSGVRSGQRALPAPRGRVLPAGPETTATWESDAYEVRFYRESDVLLPGANMPGEQH